MSKDYSIERKVNRNYRTKVFLKISLSSLYDTSTSSLYCIGMLISYYTVAVITHGVYNTSFIIGWTIFALFSPLFAYLTYMTKENNKFSKIIGVLIVLFSILSSIILFDKLRFYDYIIDFILIYFLFIKK